MISANKQTNKQAGTNGSLNSVTLRGHFGHIAELVPWSKGILRKARCFRSWNHVLFRVVGDWVVRVKVRILYNHNELGKPFKQLESPAYRMSSS